MVEAAYKLQQKNPAVTELSTAKGRGHSLTIDSGWEEVADLALAFVRRFAAPQRRNAALDEALEESFPVSDSPTL